MLWRAAAVWVVLVPLAIANGLLRERVLKRRLSDAAAHVASTLLLSALILAVAWIAVPWIRPPAPAAALGVGLLWTAMTIAFELGFGHYVAGKSWSELVADYDLTRGRVWVLVLVATATAPYLALRLRDPV